MSRQMKDVAKPTNVFHSSNSFANSNKNISSHYNNLSNLQKTAGNQAVQRLIKKGSIQTNLKVSHPSDPFEQEADRVADQVVNNNSFSFSSFQNKNGSIKNERINRKCGACEIEKKLEEEKKKSDIMNRKPFSDNSHPETSSSKLSLVKSALGSPGQPLDRQTRDFMEPRFGYDFSNVRIHSNTDKVYRSAESINSSAYTVENDIVFGRGQYQPRTYYGLRLLAHELTHVVQQAGTNHLRNNEISVRKDPSGIANMNDSPAFSHDTHNTSTRKRPININTSNRIVLYRFPSPVSFGVHKPGLALMPPIIKEGYDGNTYTAIKSNWGLSSFSRRWQIYDAVDKLLYEFSYTWPKPTLYIPKEVVAKGKSGGGKMPWSVWHEVTETGFPFGGSDPDNFPFTYMKFYVYDTWKDFMADPEAKLSDINQEGKSDKELAEPSAIQSPVLKGAGSVIDYGSVVAMHEAYLRGIYDASSKAIVESSKNLISKGLSQGDVAKWANEARNALKDKIRNDGNPILKKVFESRNLKEYGNKLGPSYEQLFAKYAKQGLSTEEINKKIIGSAGRANIKVNRWSGRLKIAGRIMLFIDVAIAGVRVYLAPEGEKTKAALEEIARIGGALVMGAVGAKVGASAGAAVGALFGGAGAIPGAIIGGFIGGIGGAIFGGWLGQSAVEKLYEMFPPSDCVFEGEFVEDQQ